MRGVEPAPDLSHQRPAVRRFRSSSPLGASGRRRRLSSRRPVPRRRPRRARWALVVGADRGDASLGSPRRNAASNASTTAAALTSSGEGSEFRSGDGTRSLPGLAPRPRPLDPRRSSVRPSPVSRRWRRPPPRSARIRDRPDDDVARLDAPRCAGSSESPLLRGPGATATSTAFVTRRAPGRARATWRR